MYLNMRDILAQLPGEYADLFKPTKADRDDLPLFSLKRGQQLYSVVGEHGKKQYCYTPHRADDGHFYTFEYVTVWRSPLMKTKKGRAQLAKTGMPFERIQPRHVTKARTRKLAYKRACDRYNAAIARNYAAQRARLAAAT